MVLNSVLALIGTLSLISSASAFQWEYCGGKQSGLQTLDDVQLSPSDPIPAGSEAHFSISGDSEVAVDDSLLKLTVYYLGIPVYHKTLERHEHIPKGSFKSEIAEPLPSYTPPGSYKVVIESNTKENELLSCIEVHFKITWPAFKRVQSWT